MTNKKASTIISLIICALCCILLVAMMLAFPTFIRFLYFDYENYFEGSFLSQIEKTIMPAFYACTPFAAVSLYMLIRLLTNILNGKTFVMKNVKYFRYISWCCYAVTLITIIAAVRYLPLIVVAIAMGIVGTLLRVVKNVMQSAVAIREENDLTI